MNGKKPVLRFRFIVIFAVLLLIAMFVVYMLQTSLEDVLENDEEEKNTTASTTVNLQNETDSSDRVVIMAIDESSEDNT